MKAHLTILLSAIVCFFTNAQNVIQEDSVYEFVEQMPEFPGGEKALSEYLFKINYPPISANDDFPRSKIWAEFVIDTTGAIINLKVTGSTDEFNQIVFQTIQNLPVWNPGVHNGRKVKVKYVVPIYICLD